MPYVETGACDCCGRIFAENTRRHPLTGFSWMGKYQAFEQRGLCPTCCNEADESGNVCAWTPQEWESYVCAELEQCKEFIQVFADCGKTGTTDLIESYVNDLRIQGWKIESLHEQSEIHCPKYLPKIEELQLEAINATTDLKKRAKAQGTTKTIAIIVAVVASVIAVVMLIANN